MNFELSVKLPCGCAVRHKVSSEQADGEVITPEALKKASITAAEIMAYWYETRFFKEKRHRCELVSDSNPMGIAPKES
jgi:hypothetical protein